MTGWFEKVSFFSVDERNIHDQQLLFFFFVTYGVRYRCFFFFFFEKGLRQESRKNLRSTLLSKGSTDPGSCYGTSTPTPSPTPNSRPSKTSPQFFSGKTLFTRSMDFLPSRIQSLQVSRGTFFFFPLLSEGSTLRLDYKRVRTWGKGLHKDPRGFSLMFW